MASISDREVPSHNSSEYFSAEDVLESGTVKQQGRISNARLASVADIAQLLLHLDPDGQRTILNIIAQFSSEGHRCEIEELAAVLRGQSVERREEVLSALRREEKEHRRERAPKEERLLKDYWTYDVDNLFALGLFGQFDESEILPQLPNFSQLCQRCSDTRILSDNFEFSFSGSRSRETAHSCGLCGMFHAKLSGATDQTPIRVYREGSNLKVDGHDQPIFRVCAYPGSAGVPEDIQVGFPILPEVGSSTHFQLLREWLRVCDESHKKYGCHHKSDGRLPTRVLDVGDDRNPNLLRLYRTSQEERGRYTALSHRWGDPKEHQKFCTYMCNIDNLHTGIDFDKLPKTFQDAVTVTRELGVRFLWIDSICIIQPHERCSDECSTRKDWDIECKQMEGYYSSSYCTIAATSAKGSTEGFLNPQLVRQCVKVPTASGSPLYVCELIDDFRSDVEEAELNQRAWVLQERALSRRIIHFTTTQTYWECGQGVHCETLTRMKSPIANFLGDPQFPKSALAYYESNRIRLFGFLFERYSKLALTNSTDRSIAISGLEGRLATTFETDGKYGIFRRYLHRSLLWHRSNGKMKQIEHQTNKVPSWSWMAYEGEISYMDIPFDRVEWSKAVGCPGNAVGDELIAPARKFLLDEMGEERGRLIFDGDNIADIQTLKCIVIGRERLAGEPSDEQEYYVLVVEPQASEKIYKRVGVGSIQRRHILFKGQEAEVRII